MQLAKLPSQDQDLIAEPLDFSPPEAEVHLREYCYLILKRRWLIAAVAITVTSVAVVGALLQTPLYSSTAVVQISRGNINLLQDMLVKDISVAEFYPTQRSILKSRTLAHRVVDQLQLWRHPPFRAKDDSEPTPETRNELAKAVQSMLSLSQVQNTQLVHVTFTTPDPELSAQLANTLVSQYISFSSETETDVARNAESFIRKQIEKLQRQIQQKEQLLQEYSERKDIVMVGQKEAIVIQQLEDLNTRLTQARTARLAAEARYRSLRAADPNTLAQVQSHPSVQKLKNQRASIQDHYAELSSKFKPDWPEMQRMRNALEEVERRLPQEIKKVAQEVVAAARAETLAALEKERLLQEAVDEQKRQVLEFNTLTANYNRIKVELENLRTMLQQLLHRHSAAGLSAELGERQPVNARVVEEALVPKRPSQPNLRRSVMMGVLVGLSLGIGLAFFLDYWDTSIHTIEDLRRHVALPYLGMVPRYAGKVLPLLDDKPKLRRLPAGAFRQKHDRSHSSRDLSRTRSSLAPALVKDAKPPSDDEGTAIAERFKFIRGSLLLSNPGTPPKTVLITGPDKHDGKTFVTCNLAVSLAELNKKVLIIDADLRNPTLHRIFRFRNRVGLSSILTGQAKVESGTIHTTPIPNVSVMLAGPLCPSPAELLSSQEMEQVLGICSKHFDYVLLDSAPLLPVFDSHSLTVRCDASLLVVRSGCTSPYAVKSSIDCVQRVGGKITGVVLNDVNLSDRAQNYYYGYYHRYGYGAYRSDERQAET